MILPEANLESFVQLICKFNRTALVKVLGFKFHGYQQAAQNPPESLYLLVAVLCRHKALDIKDMYPLLSPTDDEMVSALDKHYERLLKHVKNMRVFKTSQDDNKKEETMDASPHAQSGDDNQKLHVLAALLNVGDWPSAQHLLSNLGQLLPASYPPVAAGLSKQISAAIAPVYAKILQRSGMASVAKCPAPAGGAGDGMDVDDDQVGKAQMLPVVTEAKDLPSIMPMFQHLSVYIAYDPVLFMRLGRVLKEYMQVTEASGRDLDFVKQMLHTLIAALVLMVSFYVLFCLFPVLCALWMRFATRHRVRPAMQMQCGGSRRELAPRCWEAVGMRLGGD